MEWVLGFMARGVVLLAMWVAIIWPITYLVRRHMRDGKLKRLLFRRIS